MTTVTERFMRYAAIETTSDEASESCPSSECQWTLANLLVEEMRALGMENPHADAHGYVYGFIPANVENAPAIGLIAHMDTVAAVPGRNPKPRAVAYKGGDIPLGGGVALRPAEFPELARYVGDTLIVAGGDAVLGADDKAGVAEIMTLCEILLADPAIPHGRVCVGFTPDEEIGRGADLFDVAGFGAEYAYTVDGGAADEIEYENFNAASARVLVRGRNIHPGSAKNQMKNAARMAMEFNGMLPVRETPDNTEGYEGFYHLTRIEGEEERAELRYILRDHDAQKLEDKKARMQAIAAYLNGVYGEGSFEVVIKDSYRNMREQIEQHPHVVERAKQALAACGLAPKCVPIRGGTDGARLSFMGLPCPNLGTGGHNGHGVYEYVAQSDMEKMVEVLTALVRA